MLNPIPILLLIASWCFFGWHGVGITCVFLAVMNAMRYLIKHY